MSENIVTFSGINDVRQLFKNLSQRRLRFTFLHREMESLAFALKTTLPVELNSERDKIAYLSEYLEANQDLCTRKCDCTVPAKGMRWTRFDDPSEMINNPQRVAIDDSVPDYFVPSIVKIVEAADNVAFRFRAKIVRMDEDPECIIKYGDIDGSGNTLGVTSYYTDGTNDMQLEGYPVEVMIDRRDFPVGISIDIFDTVFDHEFEHNKGHDHTPESFDIPGFNLLDPYYHGVFRTHGPWDLLVNKNAYGGVVFA